MSSYNEYVDSTAVLNAPERKKKVTFEPSMQPSKLSERDVNSILMDHCYSRPHNRILEARFLRPTKTLFIPKKTTKKKSTNPLAPLQDYEHIIDVEAEAVDPPIIYDTNKAKYLMEECERHAASTRLKDDDTDWEDKISRTNWLPSQSRLFNGIVNILNSEHMARLASTNVYNEPILRRNMIDKSVQRFRQLMATISWDTKLLHWLHMLLLDNLSTSYLSIYFDMLQTLKSKLPTFVDKMLYGSVLNNRQGAVSNESLYPLLKRPWDPVAPSLNQDKPKKLPGNPVIIIVPTAPVTANTNQFKRLHKWISLLSNLATVVPVYTNIGTSGNRMTMVSCLDQMFATTRAKIQEVKEEYPGRSIILTGFNAGSALALQVAQVEPILCVLCLGFSLLTAEGKRGDPDDNLLELQCPVLFVVGQCSNTSLQEDMEDLRERMRVETGLIVVGAADDYLRVNKKKKRVECITQSVVDRCIVDEVGEFVSGLLLSPYPPQIRQSPSHMPDLAKYSTVERKRNNSNGSSVDSEPSSPTPRLTRPGQISLSSFGRPPGSKSKVKPKWTIQMPQGTPSTLSPSESPPLSISDIDTNSHDTPQTEMATKPSSYTIDSPNITKYLIPTSSALEKSTDEVSNKKSSDTPGSNAARGASTSQIKQSGSGIKVLENLTLNTSSSGKFLSNAGRNIDLSKITILNPMNQQKAGNSFGNVVIMSDGKIRNVNSTVKGTGNTPLMLPLPSKDKLPGNTSSASALTKSKVTKYITSKKQLMGTKAPKPSKKIPYVGTSSNVPSTLSLPTNLTSQDIMDLPIIFADDNQILKNNIIQPSDSPAPQLVGSNTKTTNSGKIVFINKQMPLQNNTGVFSPTMKRQSTPTATRSNANSVKYAKIILSKRSSNDDAKTIANLGLSSEISIKKIDSHSLNDIESQLVATSLPNPKFSKPDTTQPPEHAIIEAKLPQITLEKFSKRPIAAVDREESTLTTKIAKISSSPTNL